jgi:hypothetical protein
MYVPCIGRYVQYCICTVYVRALYWSICAVLYMYTLPFANTWSLVMAQEGRNMQQTNSRLLGISLSIKCTLLVLISVT